MIRESLTANSANTFVFLTPSNGLAVQNRAAVGGTTAFTPGPWGLAVPYRVRLARTGNTIVALASADGANWTTVATHTVSMGATVYIGLAVTSHQNDTLATAGFQQINASGGGTTAPPGAPTSLTAAPSSSSRIDLTWTDNATDEDGFKIERSTDGVTFAQIGTVGSNVTSYASTGLSAATTYTYRVRATRGTADSAYSNVASAMTPSGIPTLPAAPTNLTASAASSTRIDLAWTDNSTDEVGFKIERTSDGAPYAQIATVGTGVTTYADTGVTASKSYTYRVRAAGSAGDSAYSNAATATTPAGTTPTPLAWTGIDIGSVGVPGSHEWSGSSLTVRGSGADIWDTADAFRFVYRPLTGDGFVEAQVSSLTNTHAWAKAGVMIRDALTPNAPNTFIFLTPSNGLAVQNRSAAGARTSSTSGPWGITAPYWVRLERAGNTVVAFASPNGFIWTNTATHTVSGSTVYIGLAVTSHQHDVLATAIFNPINASGGGDFGPPAAPTNLTATTASATRINLAWIDNSSGEDGFKIERATGGGAFQQIATVGGNITTYPDTSVAPATTYAYRVRATATAGDSPFSNPASATTPASAAPPAAPAALTATAISSSQIDLAWTDASTNETGFEVERSTDGVSFARIATTAANIVRHSDAALVASTTYHYRVRAVNTSGASAYSPVARATTAAQPAPSSWQSKDIGAVAAAGSSSESGGTVTVIGSGADIWGPADEFHFRFQPFTGDGEIIARVTGLTYTDGWAKVGVMFRETLAANSRHVYLCVSAGNGAAFQYRAAIGGESSSSTAGAGAPRWLRLGRSGGTFTAHVSADGSTWTQAGTQTLTLPATINVGLAVTSHNDGVRCTGMFDNVVVRGTAPPPPPPPEPTWSFGDIGAVGRAGSNSSSGNTITISGSGADIWGTADAFRFVYRPVTGDGVVEAQVTSLQQTDLWAKAGVMIRESLAPNAVNAFAFLTPGYHGIVAQSRGTTGGATSSVAGPLRNAPYWVRLTRSGHAFVAASSPDGVTWTTYATMTIEMGATVCFGFAVTSHDNAQLNTALFTDPFVR